ncbi:helix-turn-helix domain-containing protein, partial [Enterococcus cecorum]
MEDFGTVFKKLRESRHLSLADISKMGVSTSQISRFENGESDLTITKFIAILKKMNISIDEYLYVVNNFKRDDLSELLYQINKYLINHDAKGLKNLLVTYQEKTDDSIYHRLHILIIKIRLSFLDSYNQYELKDIKELSEYLFSVEYWGIYELLIFSSVIDVLEPQLY